MQRAVEVGEESCGRSSGSVVKERKKKKKNPLHEGGGGSDELVEVARKWRRVWRCSVL